MNASLRLSLDQWDNIHVKVAKEVYSDTSWTSAHLSAIRFHFLEAPGQPANHRLWLICLAWDFEQVQEATDVNVKLRTLPQRTDRCPVDVRALQKGFLQSRPDIVITFQGST